MAEQLKPSGWSATEIMALSPAELMRRADREGDEVVRGWIIDMVHASPGRAFELSRLIAGAKQTEIGGH